MEYYDIHAHILPGVDDGPDSMEEAEQMLQMVKQEGIVGMIATPHFMQDKMRYTDESLFEVYNQVKEKAENMGISLFLGNEVYYSDKILNELNKRKIATLADSVYVLIAFDSAVTYKAMYESIRVLKKGGYRPVIAHIERYKCLSGDWHKIKCLKEAGACLQMDARSVLGSVLDRRSVRCRKMIKKGYIDILASDCHGTERRMPVMKKALEWLRKKRVNETLIRKISFDNPLRILKNEVIE